MKTVIMAGGKGTRISDLFPDIPKPLIPISNSISTKPILEWEIEMLATQGFRDILITVSHMSDKIIEFFGTGERWGVKIDYYEEKTPLGNAGALFFINFEESFLLLNADSLFNIDFNRMVRYHKEKKALVTLFTHPNSHPFDSGLIITDSTGCVKRWLSKEDERPKWYKNRVNAGLHIIDPVILKNASIDIDRIGKEINGKVYKVDLDRDILKPLCGKESIYAYDSSEYVKDMGTPERFEQVSKEFRMGVVDSKNFLNMQKAVFLDRDGTINKYVGFLTKTDEFELIDGVAEAIRRINSSGYLVIVITNQPVIARGDVTADQLREIHNKMETLLGREGAYIDAIYYCPHHPDKGFDGEIPELKINCACRKPKPGMLLQAALDYNIDLKKSWMIGDGDNDVKAGKAAGCKTVKIGEPSPDSDLNFDNLLDAVNSILDDE